MSTNFMARDLAKRASIGSRAFWVTILVVALLISVLEPCRGNPNGYVEPENCKRLECPRYQVVLRLKECEIRSYKLASWIATSPIHSHSYTDAVSQGFSTLYGYIQGNNNQRAQMNMTAPVLVDVVPSESATNTSYIVHFYLPHKYQTNPPLSRAAHPVKLPEHQYAAVRRFGGFMADADVPPQVSALRRCVVGSRWELPETSAAPNRGMGYSVAGYNSPLEYSNRVNEVIIWLDKN